MYGIRLIITI